MNPKLKFFRDQMLDFVALKERPEVAARLDAAIESTQEGNLPVALAKFYVGVLTDLLAIAQAENVIAAAEAVRGAWERIILDEEVTEGEWSTLADAAYAASHTGGVLLGPDQKALDLIVARTAARTTGIPSTDPQDTQNFKEGDGPEQALGNVGMLVALGISKAPNHPEHASILPETHTKDGKFNVASFTTTRALLYSNTITAYIDKLIALL